ncbi:DEAD/DEAH box helicase domain-containing protein [Heterostelium album PN500]|uniref:RNA helicase n=1 Tax=Heterostelium pallidum (strain ATCC 26659 / Pp 5 / PN500) TaxID=670386 RepID=D3B045_HETP5|nr:DEAD/DEAH box helicase domain-containing protein [Heterostelium album PN500]EFA84669.1 DEAD/DEAH box helicase domain-containing protein [Heterostelium album PN500]|eukprot:XP_020436782.1 DEAD/DEAH box helicase domain-containing protein [Heterostelium album PN500]
MSSSSNNSDNNDNNNSSSNTSEDIQPTTVTSPNKKQENEDEGEEPISGLIKSDQLDDYNTRLVVMQSDPNSPLYSAKTFEDLKLKPEILKGVYGIGFNKPSKIQEAALPYIIDLKQNLIAQSQSGTGKTAAFSLGMLNTVDPSIPLPQAICVCPTQELAIQIHGVVCTLGKFSSIKPLLYNNNNNNNSNNNIMYVYTLVKKIENQVIVGTPGKLLDLMSKRILPTQKVAMMVLDEADQMIDKRGMNDQSMKIKMFLPKSVQVLLFSATFSLGVEQYIKEFVPQPNISIRLKKEELSVDKIKQFYIDCNTPENKPLVLSDIYSYISIGQSIVFVHTKKTASQLATKMRAEGFSVSSITGDDSADLRMEQIKLFREGKTKLLIATNILARGIDVLQVSLVINYDVPLDVEGRPDPVTYLHRIGRVGRFGRSGVAINFVKDQHDLNKILNISKHLNREIKELKRSDIESLDAILRGLKDLTPLS